MPKYRANKSAMESLFVYKNIQIIMLTCEYVVLTDDSISLRKSWVFKHKKIHLDAQYRTNDKVTIDDWNGIVWLNRTA
jgi:hypothetical protein